MRAVKEVLEQRRTAPAGGGGEGPRGPVNTVISLPARIRQFLHEVRMEMHNVTWPAMKDVQATTIVVMIATFFFGFYLGVVLDVPIAKFLTWLLQAARTWLG